MLLRVLFVVLFIKGSVGFPNGSGTGACVTMLPSHQGNLPQTSPIPVSVTGSATNVIQGFLAQVRTLEEIPRVVGSFVVTEGMRTVNCVTHPANSVATHTDALDKARFELTWIAPEDFSGIINMHITIVGTFDTFWTGGQSSFVFVSQPTPPTAPPPADDIDVFKGCADDENKVCVGTPPGCIDIEDCRLFGSVTFEDDKFYFELLSKPGVAYAAIALSHDRLMGDDAVIECVNNAGAVSAFTSITEGQIWSDRTDVDQTIIRLKTAQLVDGQIYCRVERDAVTEVRGMKFDMLNEPHFLLLASGLTAAPNRIGPHTEPFASETEYWLNPNAPPATTEEPELDIYEGCGTEKTCMGSPAGCIGSRNCRVFGSVLFFNGRFFFGMFSKEPRVAYVALGLSDDRNMGDDSVIECVNNEGVVSAFTSFTETTVASPRIADQSIIRLISGEIIDGAINCIVERNATSTVRGRTFNLLTDEFHLMLVNGPAVTSEAVMLHWQPGLVSDRVLLTNPRILEESQRVLILVHGSLMIVAWIGTASIGIFMARYFKKTWVNQMMCGKDAWFVWHFICMVLTFVLTLSSVIIIFVEMGEWRTSVHSVTGIIVTAFVVLQPIGAVFRPKPTARNRPLFNFLHFSFGNLTHVLAIIAIFYAVPLANARLPEWTTYVIIGFAVFYLLMHALLTTIQIYGEIKRKERLGSTKNAPFMLLNKTLLGFFVLAILLFVIALVCIVSLPRS